ncbi:hypothetical protein Hanom_Chr01g00055361 [Helianthus anomalus]
MLGPFLTSSIPNLSFNILMIDHHRLRLELNTNGSFRIQTELIS